MPFERFVLKEILPSAPEHVLGSIFIPALSVGLVGSLKVTLEPSVPIQPLFVIEKLEYAPEDKLLNVNVPPLTITFCGLVVPVLVNDHE